MNECLCALILQRDLFHVTKLPDAFVSDLKCKISQDNNNNYQYLSIHIWRIGYNVINNTVSGGNLSYIVISNEKDLLNF